MMVILSGYEIHKGPNIKNDILGARCHFGSDVEWGPIAVSKCSFRVPKCNLETQNGDLGEKVKYNNKKCTPKIPTMPMM